MPIHLAMRLDYGKSRRFCDDPVCPEPVQKLSSRIRERRSASKRGGHPTIWFSTKCICAVATWWFDNPHKKVVPRSRIPRRTSHFSYGSRPRLCRCFVGKRRLEDAMSKFSDKAPGQRGRRTVDAYSIHWLIVVFLCISYIFPICWYMIYLSLSLYRCTHIYVYIYTHTHTLLLGWLCWGGSLTRPQAEGGGYTLPHDAIGCFRGDHLSIVEHGFFRMDQSCGKLWWSLARRKTQTRNEDALDK